MKGVTIDEKSGSSFDKSFNSHNSLMKSVIISILALQLRKPGLRHVMLTQQPGQEHTCSAVCKWLSWDRNPQSGCRDCALKYHSVPLPVPQWNCLGLAVKRVQD